jgi:hypothetical protein
VAGLTGIGLLCAAVIFAAGLAAITIRGARASADG